MGLPLWHVTSVAMQCFDCAWRMPSRAEHFYFQCESRVNAVLPSETRFAWSNFMLHTSQLFRHTLLSRHTSYTHTHTHTHTMCVATHIIVSRHILHTKMYVVTHTLLCPSTHHTQRLSRLTLLCPDTHHSKWYVATHITHNNVSRHTSHTTMCVATHIIVARHT
jgi:hypothetical protein